MCLSGGTRCWSRWRSVRRTTQIIIYSTVTGGMRDVEGADCRSSREVREIRLDQVRKCRRDSSCGTGPNAIIQWGPPKTSLKSNASPRDKTSSNREDRNGDYRDPSKRVRLEGPLGTTPSQPAYSTHYASRPILNATTHCKMSQAWFRRVTDADTFSLESTLNW